MDSEKTRDPALDVGQIINVRLAEAQSQTFLVDQHSEVKPDSATDCQKGSREGLKRESQTYKEDNMAEIHGVAGIGIGSARNQPIRRSIQTGSTAAALDSVHAGEAVL